MFLAKYRRQAALLRAEKRPPGDKTGKLVSDEGDTTTSNYKHKETNQAEDEQELLRDGTSEKNHRKRIWFTSIQPWCKGVAGSAFFIMSLYQSLSFLVKYMSGPILTVTELQKVTVDDMPWITICAYPGYSLVKMNKYRGILFPEKNWTDWRGIDPALFGEVHKANVTVSEFLSDVAMSPVTNETEMWVLRSDGSWYTTEFPSNVWNNEGRIDVALDSPVMHESNIGTWETQLLGMYRTGFEPCTTWRPNVTFSEIQIDFKVNLAKDFFINDLSIMSTIPPEEDFMPTFWIYATQPHRSPDAYNFASLLDGTGYRQLKIGRKEQARYQLSMEKFTMLNTESSPCSHDEEVIENAMQCRTTCMEATFMATACRLPGYRVRHALPKSTMKIPPVCNTSEDYAKWHSLDWEGGGRDAFEACQALCLDSCTNMQYEWMDLSAASVGDFDGQKNFSDVWGDPKTRTLSYSVEAPKRQQKVTSQQLAYDSHQLISELGGTWGLFLGLSFVDVLRFLENILLHFL